MGARQRRPDRRAEPWRPSPAFVCHPGNRAKVTSGGPALGQHLRGASLPRREEQHQREARPQLLEEWRLREACLPRLEEWPLREERPRPAEESRPLPRREASGRRGRHPESERRQDRRPDSRCSPDAAG